MFLAWALLRKFKVHIPDETTLAVETDDEIYQDGDMVLFTGREIRDSDGLLEYSPYFKYF